MKYSILFLMLIVVSSFSLVQAEVFGYGRTESIPINYSTIPTVNNSEYFDGYSTSSLYTYYRGLLETYFGGLFSPITEPLSLHLNGDNSPTATIDWDGQDLINVNNLNATTLTVGNANIEDTYWNFTKLLNGTLVQNSTLNTRLGDYIKNNTDGYVIKASEVNVTGYGYFSWLGNLANKITTIFAVTIHADVLNSTGTIYSNQTCYTQDCSARIYHNGTGIIITS